jgi:hypothetical protein
MEGIDEIEGRIDAIQDIASLKKELKLMWRLLYAQILVHDKK